MKKYELTGETKKIEVNFEEVTLHRIRAIKDFGNVKAGDLGGWIEKEENLSQKGKAWVCGTAEVYGNAMVGCDAVVYDHAEVYGNATVGCDAVVYNHANVCGDACVYGNAMVYGDAMVGGYAEVTGNAKVYGNAEIYGDARVSK